MWRLIATLAWRNLGLHRNTSVIVGGLVGLGAALVVLGTSGVEAIEVAMKRSIVSSLTGHLQIYSEAAKDKPALFGSGFAATQDLGEISNFGKVRRALEGLPEVKAVVPMGIQLVAPIAENAVDRLIQALRDAMKSDPDKIPILRARLIEMGSDMEDEHKRYSELAADQQAIDRALADLAMLRSEAFWSDLEKNPEAGFYFLDTRIAPLYDGGLLVYFRNVGTDIDRFIENFDRFELVSGQTVPSHQRGLMLAHKFYELRLKNRVAAELDLLHEGIVDRGKSMAKDEQLAARARRLPGQYRVVLHDLRVEVSDLQEVLNTYLGTEQPKEPSLAASLQAFLTLHDGNFRERYEAFYRLIAPRIRLYRVQPGDTLTLRAMTKSGYLRSVNVKLWGIFRLKGMEDSFLAGAQNLIDLVSFRELYGLMTPAMRAELSGIREAVGAQEVVREEAEEALFGGDQAAHVQEAKSGVLGVQTGHLEREVDTGERRFSDEDIDEGIALNAAVILHDSNGIEAGQAAVARVSKEMGLNLKVVDWREASGLLGHLFWMLRAVLYFSVLIIFLVALAVINNVMVTAAVDRVTEIGTIRAIGGTRGFVVTLFLAEILTVGILGGLAGAVIAVGGVLWFGHAGIPAVNIATTFLFSGPRLYPLFAVEHFAIGAGVILSVCFLSAWYPARLAARTPPVVAMESRE